jgi:hypothetical protein
MNVYAIRYVRRQSKPRVAIPGVYRPGAANTTVGLRTHLLVLGSVREGKIRTYDLHTEKVFYKQILQA